MRIAVRLAGPGGLLFFLALGFGVAAAPAAGEQSASRGAFYDGLSAADRGLARASVQQTLERRLSRDMGRWRNDASGNSGAVMPLRTFRVADGQYCREYKETIVADGKIVSRLGTACRTDDGAWIPVEP